jgi:hypothetical protein
MSPLGDLWSVLRPGILPIPVAPETEHVLKRVFFAGAAAALSLHGQIQAEEHRVTRRSLETLEAEIAEELQLPEDA